MHYGDTALTIWSVHEKYISKKSATAVAKVFIHSDLKYWKIKRESLDTFDYNYIFMFSEMIASNNRNFKKMQWRIFIPPVLDGNRRLFLIFFLSRFLLL